MPNEMQNETIICSPKIMQPEIGWPDERSFFGADALVEELSTSALLPKDQVPWGTIWGT
jgi:hypothetical protein